MLSPTISTLGCTVDMGTVGRLGSQTVLTVFEAGPLVHPKQFSRCGGTVGGYSKWQAPFLALLAAQLHPAGQAVSCIVAL